MTSEYTVKLDIFEGPLDLLLHLIKVNEMEITEISISRITTQYLDALRLMETLDLEWAGDFLVMAATLLNIKLRSILPEPEAELEEGEAETEGDDYLSARALMQRLIEYRKFKEAAQLLGQNAERQSLIFVREVALPTLTQAREDPHIRGDLSLLLEAFSRVINFVQRRDYHQVQGEEFTVEDKIQLMRRRALLEPRISVTGIFKECQSKIEMIVILIAILELCRLKEFFIVQNEAYDDILLLGRRENTAGRPEPTDEAEQLARLEKDILANRTGLVDDGKGIEDEEQTLLDSLLGEDQAQPFAPPPPQEPEALTEKPLEEDAPREAGPREAGPREAGPNPPPAEKFESDRETRKEEEQGRGARVIDMTDRTPRAAPPHPADNKQDDPQ